MVTTIKDFLNETGYASSKIIEVIWDDSIHIDKLKMEIQIKAQLVQKEYESAISMQMYADDPDDVMAGVGRYWENHFGMDKEVHFKNEELIGLTKLLFARQFSITTLCGYLLEQSRKGLSLIYGNPRNWPSGRLIGTQAISKIILESRNQSIHINEAITTGKYQKADIGKCFSTLETEIDKIFADYLKRDMSFDIVKMFHWKTLDEYQMDLNSIQ
jgi:hypothetical protein